MGRLESRSDQRPRRAPWWGKWLAGVALCCAAVHQQMNARSVFPVCRSVRSPHRTHTILSVLNFILRTFRGKLLARRSECDHLDLSLR